MDNKNEIYENSFLILPYNHLSCDKIMHILSEENMEFYIRDNMAYENKRLSQDMKQPI